MTRRLLVNRTALETRLALVEDGQLTELQVEHEADDSLVGNLYLGRVVRVLPGMQATFIDIGVEKAAFMHVSDLVRTPERDEDIAGGEGDDASDAPPPGLDLDDEEVTSPAAVDADRKFEDSVASIDDEVSPADEPRAPEPALQPGGNRAEASQSRKVQIEDLVTPGQELLVQVSKDPIGQKGPRVTSHISLPGRYLVYMPLTSHIGVSRRIEHAAERARLRECVSEARGDRPGGFIVRTACEGLSRTEIASDIEYLTRLWESVRLAQKDKTAPAPLHRDLDVVLRAVRDMATPDLMEIVVDRPSDQRRIVDFVQSVLQPELASRVRLHDGLEPIFDAEQVEAQAARALERRVWLKSGGYLVFDQTEALTTIDVNSGRFVGKSTHEETVLRVNLEAARVAIDQLRLRGIGGIIVSDFIDMEEPGNRQKVSDALAEAVKRDRARTNILRISELGLVQMTRKRTRESLRQRLTEACPTCAGEGRRSSGRAAAAAVLRAAQRRCAAANHVGPVVIRANAEVAALLRTAAQAGDDDALHRSGIGIVVNIENRLDRTESEVELTSSRRPRRRRNRKPAGGTETAA